MNYGISFNSAAKGRAVSQLTGFVLLPRQGPLTLWMWLRQTRSLYCASTCCASLCVIVLICMLSKTALIMCSSQGKASIHSIWPGRLSSCWPPKEMIFLLVIHGIFVCVCSITFIYSASHPPSSLIHSLWFSLLLWLQLLMQNQMHAEWGPFAWQKSQSISNVPFHMLHILAGDAAHCHTTPRFSATT